MKIAIMQPYIFPYIGYFQLIHEVDKFVFYDDVNFIKRGWINRNRLLVNGKESLFTIALIKASQNKLINEIEIFQDSKNLQQFLKTLEYNYKNAPYFDTVFNLVLDIINRPYTLISDLAINSIKIVSHYLEIDTLFEISSENYSETKGLGKSERLIAISQKAKADTYVNSIGGKEMYTNDSFEKSGLKLHFIESDYIEYTQFDNEFVPWLSIIDLMMFQSKEEIKFLLEKFKTT